jgi:peptide/nickel transport system ATP-binding protein
MSAFIEVRNLSTYFTQRSGWLRQAAGLIRAVDDVSFTIQAGQIVGVIGESGSGKTTLAKSMLLLEKKSAGEIVVDGVDISLLSRKELLAYRKKLQIVFQNPADSLNMRKTIYEALNEVLVFHAIVETKNESIDFLHSLLLKVGLNSSCLSRYPHELSIGQQQRICIARSLCTKPKLLVLDECTSALDISVQAEVLNLLLTLHREEHLSYLLISHDLNVVYHLADEVLVLYQGKIVESGPTESLFHDPQHPYTKKLLASRL